MHESVHIDPELAGKADRLFRELGLDLHTAIDLFLRQSLRENALPFTLRLISPAMVENSPPGADSHDEAPSYSSLKEGSNLCPSQDAVSDDAAAINDDLEADHFTPAMTAEGHGRELEGASVPLESPAAASSPREGKLSDLRQAFFDMGLIGAPLRRVRTMNQLYAMGEGNPHVPGWRECYVSGDEPFALDFGSLRIELGFRDGGSLRMMDGRLPDEVLEADAIFPRDLSAVFSSVVGQRLSDVDCVRMHREGRDSEQLRMRFTNGCILTFAPDKDWCALWLSDPHGSVMFAPDTVWMRTLGERSWQALR